MFQNPNRWAEGPDENKILQHNIPCTNEYDAGSQQHWSNFVEHLKGPIIDGNICRSDQERQDLGK